MIDIFSFEFDEGHCILEGIEYKLSRRIMSPEQAKLNLSVDVVYYYPDELRDQLAALLQWVSRDGVTVETVTQIGMPQLKFDDTMLVLHDPLTKPENLVQCIEEGVFTFYQYDLYR